MAELSDETIVIQRIVARDQTAFAELYDAFAGSVYGVSLRVLRNATLAEEATQDTFMKVWDQADRWNPERGSFRTWVLTIARYTAVDRLRKEQRQSPPTAVSVDEMLELIGRSGVVDQTRWENRDLLKQLVRQLPPEQITALELAFFQGMSHTEIAEHLDQPLGTVKSRIRQGLITLKGLWLQHTGS